MNLSQRVCALLAPLVAALGLSGRLVAKPPDLPVNHLPVLAPEDGSAEASPPAGGAIRMDSQQPVPRDTAEMLQWLRKPWSQREPGRPGRLMFQVKGPGAPQNLSALDEPASSFDEDESKSPSDDNEEAASSEMLIQLRVLRQPWKSPEYIKEHQLEWAGTAGAIFVSNRQQAPIDPIAFYATGTCEQLEELNGGKQQVREIKAVAVNRLRLPLLLLKEPWRGPFLRKVPGQLCLVGYYDKMFGADSHYETFYDLSEAGPFETDKAPRKSQAEQRTVRARQRQTGGVPLLPRGVYVALSPEALVAEGEDTPTPSSKPAPRVGAPTETKSRSLVRPWLSLWISMTLTRQENVEGPTVPIDKISFRGNTFASARRLSRLIKSSERLPGRPETGNLDPMQVMGDTDELLQYYHRHGFLDAKVKSHLEWAPEGWGVHLTFQVKEGKRYRVPKVPEVVGDLCGCPHEQVEAFSTIKPGSYYSAEAVELDKKKIEAWYGYRGQKVQVYHYQVFDKDKPGVIYVQYQVQKRPLDKVGEVIHSSDTCPAEQHQAGSEEKSEATAGVLQRLQSWLDGREHGTLMLGMGLDEQLRWFVRCSLKLGDQVYHLVLGRGWPALWTTPNAARPGAKVKPAPADS